MTGIGALKPWLLAQVYKHGLFLMSQYVTLTICSQTRYSSINWCYRQRLLPKDSWYSYGGVKYCIFFLCANNVCPQQQVREATPKAKLTEKTKKKSGKTRERQTGWRRWVLVCHCKQHYIIKPIEFPAVFQACWPAATFLIQQLPSTEAV